jgi:hypothetical protein
VLKHQPIFTDQLAVRNKITEKLKH